MKATWSLLLLSYLVLLGGWILDVRVVTTPSVPLGLYRTHHVRTAELTRGTFVCIRAISDYAPRQLQEAAREREQASTWIKVVTALPGDLVSRSVAPARLEINGVGLPDSAALATDSKGRSLPMPIYPIVIQPNQVWLSSLHPLGYDSRYFGAVDMRAISCTAEPLWTL